ncbi:MAG: HTH araC/xylS-type domain-containing protein [Lachnoclostridium sp.]|jgi:AraC family transcriptional regulator, arabinose operon regulatory protein
MYIHHIALGCIHGNDYVVKRPNGLIDYLFLYIQTPSTLIINERMYTIINPTAILIDSYTPHKYFPTGLYYMDDYLHFAVNDKITFMEELFFPFNTPVEMEKNNDIHSILFQIHQEHTHSNKYSSQISKHLIHILLIKVGEQWNSMQQKNTVLPHYNDLLSVRSQILNSPEKVWTVEELAKMSHLSRAYFQVMYKKVFGVTCITDVINTKISYAKVLLSSTNLSIKEISQKLSYNDVYHFIRQFKKNTGLTPGAFRKKIIC